MKKSKKFTNLFKKLKKVKTVYKVTFSLLFLLYLASIVLICYSLILLTGIETLIRVIIIIFAILYLMFYILFGLVFLITKRHGLLITTLILSIIFTGINVLGYYYITKTYQVVDNISKDKVTYTTDLVALSSDTEISTVGMLNNDSSIEGYTLPQEYIANNGKKWEITYYDDNVSLLTALYNGEVDAIFITSNYQLLYSDDDTFPNLATETVVIDSYSKTMENQDTAESTNKSVTEPFTILLLGVDSQYDGLSNNAAFNGDTIMLITFNPKTLSATVFSIPRDTYVPIACNNNKSYKINSAAAYGTSCMINTIQNLTDIDIDYYLKINFKGVVSLVDALGGIEVDVPEPDYPSSYCTDNSSRTGEVCLTPGVQTLDGEHALALARNRHAFAIGDFQRVQNQQLVVEAIINKAKTITSLSEFYKVLNTISKNLDTNMSTKQMLNLYNVGKNILLNSNFDSNEFINVQKTYLTGYDLTLYVNGSSTYTFQYYKESLDEIVDAMKVNLELEDPEIVKTFNFSVNDTYEVATIGKTYSTVKRNETLPNFVGTSLNYVEAWVSARNITLNTTYSEGSDCTNNYVLSQTVHSSTLVSNISTLGITVCKNNTSNSTTDDTDDNSSTTTTTTKTTTTTLTTTTTTSPLGDAGE